MKLKYVILALIAILAFENSYGQTSNNNKKEKKVKLEKYTLEKDSTLATWNIIASTPSLANVKKKMLFTESMGKCRISFSPDHKKGIIHVDFENLPKHVKPELTVSNLKGDVIFKHEARFANNVVNMRKLPPGSYLFTADVDEEISTWEFVKK